MSRPNLDLIGASGLFRLPDLLPPALLEGTSAVWPGNSPIHTLKETMTIESIAWVKSLGVMSDKKLAAFAKYEIMILTAWAYRRVGPQHFRLCSDFMHLFWIIDDITDDLPSVEVVLEVANIKRILADPNDVSTRPSVLERVCQRLVSNNGMN